jgi:hypothetical protein
MELSPLFNKSKGTSRKLSGNLSGCNIDRDLVTAVDGMEMAGGCSRGKIPITIPKKRDISGMICDVARQNAGRVRPGASSTASITVRVLTAALVGARSRGLPPGELRRSWRQPA